MDCPVCKEPMIVLELKQVEIDHCTECGGIWLDSGELDLLLGDSKSASGLLDSFKSDTTAGEKKHKCPICRKKMSKVLCGPENNIRIDRCSNSDGLWFDRGELRDIIKTGQLGEKSEVLDLIKDMFKDNVEN